MKSQNDPGHHLFHNFFFLIRKSDRVVVGSADFKTPPNQSGEVEIGYGLGKTFEHNGYMTEAVKVLCEFAAKRNDISHLIAETDIAATAHTLMRRDMPPVKDAIRMPYLIYVILCFA